MKKKLIAALILSALLLCAISVSCFAASSPTVSLESKNASPGDTVEIAVSLSGNTGFASLAIEVDYDDGALTLLSVAPVSAVGASYTSAPALSTKPYNMLWDSGTNISYNGTLAVMSFKVNEGAAGKAYPITVDFYKGREGNNVDGDDINYDENFDPVGFTYTDGAVTVNSGEALHDWNYTRNENSFTLTDTPQNDGQALAVFYTQGGKMISFNSLELNKSCMIPNGTAKIKLFMLSGLFVPQCKAGDVK